MAEPMARAGELTSGIVHEVRNGLGTIVGYARLIEQSAAGGRGGRGGGAHPRGVRDAGDGRAALHRVREGGIAEPGPGRRAPHALARGRARVARRAGRRGVAGPRPPRSTLRGDEELLERAFENLVRNAREAAGEAGHVGPAGAARGRRGGAHGRRRRARPQPAGAGRAAVPSAPPRPEAWGWGCRWP